MSAPRWADPAEAPELDAVALWLRARQRDRLRVLWVETSDVEAAGRFRLLVRPASRAPRAS